MITTPTLTEVRRVDGEWTLTCRACGPIALPDLDSLKCAFRVRQQHLTEHLKALADEMEQAAR